MKYSKLLGMVIWMKGVISFMELDFDYCDPSANHDQYHSKPENSQAQSYPANGDPLFLAVFSLESCEANKV